MLRDSDTTPSFSVNDKAGTWYDHGEGKGGNIIDFALRYWPGLTFPEVMEKILSVSRSSPLPASINFQRKAKAIEEPKYGILKIRELGHNNILTTYLESRGIADVAADRLQEVYYYVEDENKFRSNYFATGWLNETGSWEVRNAYFKGCLGKKAITFIPNSDRRLAVFEGYFDYLSWLTDNPFATESVLVLNSLALLQLGLAKARSYRDVYLYFDHDPSGERATLDFKQAKPDAIDCSGIYKGFNDYNEKIVARQNGFQFTR
jgi:DNA primase